MEIVKDRHRDAFLRTPAGISQNFYIWKHCIFFNKDSRNNQGLSCILPSDPHHNEKDCVCLSEYSVFCLPGGVKITEPCT